MSKTFIIGHQKPDTDSVVAALALEFLFNQQKSFGYQNAQAAIVDPINNETKYLLDRFKIPAPELITAQNIAQEDQVILVDHNEESQRLANLDPGQIVEIIDHHKANFNFSNPIYLNFKPWGSTTSIVYFMMQRFASKPIKPTQKLAALMLAAILSDTVGFKSSTTTKRDKDMTQELAGIAQISDLEQFTLDIFKAKSDLSSLTPQQLVKNYYKKFEFNRSTFIGQLETVQQAEILATQKQELLKAMQEVKQDENVELIFLAVTDVLKTNTKLLVADSESEAVAEKAFSETAQDGVIDIGPRLSRKKDIAPAIEQALKNISK